MGKYFGTDGFRGEANTVLTAEHAFKIGRYLGWYYNQNSKGRIVIGKDTRRSSYMYEYALVAGITASGSVAFLSVDHPRKRYPLRVGTVSGIHDSSEVHHRFGGPPDPPFRSNCR